jgi:hypothetical protein
MILLGAVRERLGPGAVRTGTAFVSFAESPAGVLVRVRDRSSGKFSVLRGDVPDVAALNSRPSLTVTSR